MSHDLTKITGEYLSFNSSRWEYKLVSPLPSLSTHRIVEWRKRGRVMTQEMDDNLNNNLLWYVIVYHGLKPKKILD